MISYMAANAFTKFFVIILQFLCSCVFILIQGFCSTFMNLATLQISTGFVDEFLNRIYVIVGILMLFKLSFSLLTAVVSPDKLTDKEKGFGKIIQRTIVCLIMLIFVPIIFTKALGWQTSLAKLVPRLIVGSEFTNSESANSVGSQLASDALKPFIIPNSECVDGADLEGRLGETNNLNEVLGVTILTCEEAGGTGRNIFAYEFNGIIATVVGVIMVVILAGYCIDMAIRVIKLGILRILAPIPIISYIDPKSEKSGAFGNWLKECISTYIELFIKLAIFYFVLEILGNLSSENVEFFANSENLNGFVWLFIMLGAFFFMGKAADFIYNILGLKKPSTAGGLLKGLAGIGAAVGIGAATLSSARTNYRGSLASQKANGIINPSKGKAIASAILGGGVGAVTASKAVAGAKSGKMGAAISAANKRNAAYASAAASGATFGGKASSYFQRAFTGQTQADRLEQEIKTIEDNSKNIGNIVSRADDKAKTSKDTVGISKIKDANGNVKQVAGNYQQWSAAFNAAKARGIDGFKFNGTDVTMEEAERLDFGLLTSNSECYIKNHGFGDKEFQEMIVDYERANPGKHVNASTTRKDMKDKIEELNVSKTQKSRELQIAKANAGATNGK